VSNSSLRELAAVRVSYGYRGLFSASAALGHAVQRAATLQGEERVVRWGGQRVLESRRLGGLGARTVVVGEQGHNSWRAVLAGASVALVRAMNAGCERPGHGGPIAVDAGPRWRRL